jgi:hypothetical protein
MGDVGRATLPAAGQMVEGQPMVEQENGCDGAQIGRISTAAGAEVRPVPWVKVGPVSNVHHTPHPRPPHFKFAKKSLSFLKKPSKSFLI